MSVSINKQLQLAISRGQRLKSARDQAEQLLEKKSTELYRANKELEAAQKSLESDIEKATLELSISNKRLQKALDERSTFIGHMSHEVRTPLNAISGLSEILLSMDLDNTQFDYIDTINNAAKSLTSLLNDMLDMTKIDAGRVDITLGVVAIEALHKNIASMFSVEAKIKNLDLQFQFDPSVPPMLLLDKGRYQQVINNLVSNAIKNTSRGRVVLSVQYQRKDDTSGTLVTQVSDTGVGIADTELSRIFNAYEQLGNPQGGVGLGLAISGQLIELMNGRITCNSKLGEGSAFTVSLPVNEPVNTEVELGEFVEGAAPALKVLTVLVAEDNPTNQKVIAAQLAELGQIADLVSNGQEALSKLQERSYDLVLMDIQMPVMDGKEAMQLIRSADSRIAAHYCVALTASCHESQGTTLTSVGFDDVLSKPLGIDRLSRLLSSVPTPHERAEQHALLANGAFEESIGFDGDYLREQFGEQYHLIFEQVAPTFLEHTSRDFDDLKSAIFDGRISKVKALSHSINGAVSSMGLSQLSSQLMQIENEPASLQVPSWVQEIEADWKIVEMQIKQELSRLESGV